MVDLQCVIHSTGPTKHYPKALRTPTPLTVILNMQVISTGYALVGVIVRPITQYFSYKTHAIRQTSASLSPYFILFMRI